MEQAGTAEGRKDLLTDERLAAHDRVNVNGVHLVKFVSLVSETNPIETQFGLE